MSDDTPSRGQQFLERIQLLFYAAVALSLLLFGYLYFRAQQPDYEPPLDMNRYGELVNPLRFGIGTVALADVVASMLIFRSILRRLRPGLSLGQKLMAYRRATRLRIFLLLAASLLSLFFYYFTADPYFAILYLLVLFVFTAVRPAWHPMQRELQLNTEEMAQLRQVPGA